MDETKNRSERIREAFKDVLDKGTAIRKAAREHGIPEATLRRRLNDPNGLDVKMGAPPKFSRKQKEGRLNIDERKNRPERIREAFQDVLEKGISIRKAARKHGIAEYTLRKKLNDPKGLDAEMGAPPNFSIKQEEEPVQLNINERKNEPERIREAFQDVSDKGISIKKAAREHGIPEYTLRIRLNDPEGLDVEMGAPPKFPIKQEEEPVQLNMDEKKNQRERIREAFQDVLDKGIAIRKAAREHGIPEATLRRRLNAPKGLDVKMGAPTTLSPKEEEELASYCIKMALIGYKFSRWQVIDLAANVNMILQRDRSPSTHWFYGFLSRNPEIAMIKPKQGGKVRDDVVTEETLRLYFSQLNNLLSKYDLVNKPAQIWNVDESGISLDYDPPKVLARRGTLPHMVTAEHSTTTTVIAAASALGETIPPYMIYKGERLSKKLTTGGLKGTEYRTSPSGCPNSILFLDFLKNHFLHHVTTRPCILLYNGYSTHVTADIIQTAKEENVHLFALPPHTSHGLQPLDVPVFGPFKRDLSREFHEYSLDHPNSIITREQLPQLVSKAYVSALTVENVTSGFQKNGIYPLDASAVDTSAPAIISQPKSTTENKKQTHDNMTLKMLFQDKKSLSKTTKSDVPPKKVKLSRNQ